MIDIKELFSKKEVTTLEGIQILSESIGPADAISWASQTYRQVHNPSDLIDNSLSWSDTKEGCEYWSERMIKEQDYGRKLYTVPTAAPSSVAPSPKPSKSKINDDYESALKQKELDDEKKRQEFKKIHEEALEIAEKARKKLALHISQLKALEEEIN